MTTTNALIREVWIDRTANAICGGSEIYESSLSLPIDGRQFRDLTRSFGRCIGKMYVDPDAQHIGYIFQKREKYEDSDETFLQETWLSFHTAKDTHTITHHYADLDS